MQTTHRGVLVDKEVTRLADAFRQDLEDFQEADPTVAFRGQMAERREIISVHLDTLRRLFPIVWNINERWRVAVFRGEEPYSKEQDTLIYGLFRRVEALADPVQQKIEFFERHHTPFDPSLKTDLRLYFQEVKKIVAEWKAPVLSSCKALRTRYVSAEEAAALGLPVPS